jgi:hypothetical protein
MPSPLKRWRQNLLHVPTRVHLVGRKWYSLTRLPKQCTSIPTYSSPSSDYMGYVSFGPTCIKRANFFPNSKHDKQDILIITFYFFSHDCSLFTCATYLGHASPPWFMLYLHIIYVLARYCLCFVFLLLRLYPKHYICFVSKLLTSYSHTLKWCSHSKFRNS